jgi:hypothetical protein
MGVIAVTRAHLTTVNIVYRCGARDSSAQPLLDDSDAALRRLNEGNAIIQSERITSYLKSGKSD